MERRINKQIEQYITTFKEEIKKKLFEINSLDKHSANKLMEYIYDYERLVIDKDDFIKRKRNDVEIPLHDQCVAIANNGEKCKRRKKKDCSLCLLHNKEEVIPKTKKNKKQRENKEAGVIAANDEFQHQTTQSDYETETELENKPKKQIEIWTEEMDGIVYYKDKYDNLYKPEDILDEKQNPAIIGKATQKDGVWKFQHI